MASTITPELARRFFEASPEQVTAIARILFPEERVADPKAGWPDFARASRHPSAFPLRRVQADDGRRPNARRVLYPRGSGQ